MLAICCVAIFLYILPHNKNISIVSQASIHMILYGLALVHYGNNREPILANRQTVQSSGHGGA